MCELKTQGIWTEEDKQDIRFVRYFNIVQRYAIRKNAVFFCWAGEGHVIITDVYDGEDLSGWLVPMESVAVFEPLWEKDRMQCFELFEEFFCFAEWSYGENNEILVDFVFY